MLARSLLFGVLACALRCGARGALPPSASPAPLAAPASPSPGAPPAHGERLLSPAQAKVAALLAQRTVSASRQFIIFCPDPEARSRVAGFVEEVKTCLLELLGAPDSWKAPILLTLENSSSAAPEKEAASLSLFQNETGFKLQIDVRLGVDPARINLQKYVVRALLIEFAYRERPDLLKAGSAFVEPPWWLVEGALQLYQHRGAAPDADLFKRIVDVNHVPPMARFLAGTPHDFAGTAVETMDQACALCLVQGLADQPNGHDGLARLVRHWVEHESDVVGAITREFPALGTNEAGLQKWWTLNLARFSAADRYRGLSPEETEKELTPLLQLEISADDGKTKASYGVADFPTYLKLKAARGVLTSAQSAMSNLGLRASALYRPIVAEYAALFDLLARGKTRGVKGRLAKIDQLRAGLHKRTTDIADYLNWFEATQMSDRSSKFSSYLKIANDFAHPAPRTDPVARFLDEVSEGR